MEAVHLKELGRFHVDRMPLPKRSDTMDVLSDTANAAMEVSCAYGYTTMMRCPRLGHANAVTPQGISTSLSLSR